MGGGMTMTIRRAERRSTSVGDASKTGREAPRLPQSTGASSFPRKREPTPYPPTPVPSPAANAASSPLIGDLCITALSPSAVPSPAAFAASSPLIGRGGCGACAPLDSGLRRNDGMLCKGLYKEREDWRLRAEWIPAFAGMTDKKARAWRQVVSARPAPLDCAPARRRRSSDAPLAGRIARLSARADGGGA